MMSLNFKLSKPLNYNEPDESPVESPSVDDLPRGEAGEKRFGVAT
jgi:hypothetical protein